MERVSLMTMLIAYKEALVLQRKSLHVVVEAIASQVIASITSLIPNRMATSPFIILSYIHNFI